MQTTLRFAPVPRVAWLLVLLGFWSRGAAGVLVGSRTRELPAAVRAGPQRHRGLCQGRGHPADGSVDGGNGHARRRRPESISAPYYSRDGRLIVFLRRTVATANRAVVAVADADGTNVRVLTGQMTDQNWFDWSPDGSLLALISTIDGSRRITIVPVDGSASTILDVGMEAEFASWRGPVGAELIFRGSGAGGVAAGLFAVKPDGTGVHQVSLTLGADDATFQRPIDSPDGRFVLYSVFEPTSGRTAPSNVPNVAYEGNLLRLHVLDLVAGIDLVIPPGIDPTDATLPVDHWGGAFSPDGTQIAFIADRNNGTMQLAIAPSDGSGSGRSIGPTVAKPGDGDPIFEFSPDGMSVVAAYPGEGTVRVLPIDGSASSTLPWDGNDLPNTQRLAP